MMSIDRDRADLPLFAASIAVFVWAFGPLFVKSISVSAPTIVFWRVWLGVPIMWLAARWRGARIDRAVLRLALVPGLLFAGSMVTGFEAQKTTSIANATLIPALTPALILLVAGRLFGEHPRRVQYLLAAAAFAGVAIVVMQKGSGQVSSLSGDLYAVGNLVVWTMYFIMAKRVRSAGANAWSYIAAVFIVMALAVTPWSLAVSHDMWNSKPRDWVLYGCMAVFPGLIGHGLMTWAQKGLDITVSSMLTLANAPLSTIGAWIVFGQSLKPLQVAGAMLVIVSLAGIAVVARSAIAHETPKRALPLSAELVT